MDEEARDAEREKLVRRHKCSMTYCAGCGGSLSVESPHPLGLPLVVLSCPSCGREETFVKRGDGYTRPGRKPDRPKL